MFAAAMSQEGERSDDEFDDMEFEDEKQYAFGGQENDEEDITEEDAWTVISSNFAEKGLVRQQLDSFDVFMTTTMQVSLINSFSLRVRADVDENFFKCPVLTMHHSLFHDYPPVYRRLLIRALILSL